MVLGRLKEGWRASEGAPLDRQLRDRLGLSWKNAKALVTTGKVHLDGALATSPQQIPASGALITVDTDRRRPSRRITFDPARILHQDEHLLIVDKPAGLVSVPPTRTGEATLQEQLAELTGGIVRGVHRLDNGTSGLMVFARSDTAGDALDAMFRRHDVRRTYLALCHGHPSAPTRWDESLTLNKPDAPPRQVSAVTNVLTASPAGPAALIHLALETGRWHQIRLHAALHGHPLLGDRTHGDPLLDQGPHPKRLALHSHSLELQHPITRVPLTFQCPLPTELADLLERLHNQHQGQAR